MFRLFRYFRLFRNLSLFRLLASDEERIKRPSTVCFTRDQLIGVQPGVSPDTKFSHGLVGGDAGQWSRMSGLQVDGMGEFRQFGIACGFTDQFWNGPIDNFALPELYTRLSVEDRGFFSELACGLLIFSLGGRGLRFGESFNSISTARAPIQNSRKKKCNGEERCRNDQRES